MQNCLANTSTARYDTTASSVFSTNSLKMLDQLPRQFVKVSKTKSSIQFTTEPFSKINDRLSECVEEIYYMSNKFALFFLATCSFFNMYCVFVYVTCILWLALSSIMDQLLANLKEHFVCFYKLSECVSTLDMIISLADYAADNQGQCTRPMLGDVLILSESVHPVLKTIKDKSHTAGHRRTRPNDVSMIASDESVANTLSLTAKSSFLLVTGANMSGKSTLLKQCGLLQIMAQCGSFVPSNMSIFHVKKNIMCISGEYSDDVDLRSSFEREMADICHIMQNVDTSSLLLVDELCRSTNYYEGLSITLAICEHLLTQIRHCNTTVLFATHFRELTFLGSLFANIQIHQMRSVEEDNERLSYSYKLEKGECQLQNYGMFLLCQKDP